MKKKKVIQVLAGVATVLLLAGCAKNSPSSVTSAETAVTESETQETTGQTQAVETTADSDQEEVTILVAAAASLKYAYDEKLIPMFEEQYPMIKVTGTYDSSGKLQTQIEEGLEADLFMSAAAKQMNALTEQELIDQNQVVDLLENKVVLITPANTAAKVTGFEDIMNAEIIAIGDPESVPAGQYAKEILTSLGSWEAVEAKSTKGTNVTEVLNWVAEGSADAGIVYATDAATTTDVTIVAEAPAGSLEKPVIYPVGLIAASQNQEEAELFLAFLQTPEAMEVFESYGFSPVQ